jgi:hypothetical protein
MEVRITANAGDYLIDLVIAGIEADYNRATVLIEWYDVVTQVTCDQDADEVTASILKRVENSRKWEEE